MLLRIVRMTFKTEEVDNFLRLFDEHKEAIRESDGCTGLELMRDKDNPMIFFTYSRWHTKENLEAYRKSELFKKIWPKTKSMFSERAEAWSVDKIVSLP